MNLWQENVRTFHRRFKIYEAGRPAIPPELVHYLRTDLVSEEHRELLDAMNEKNLVKIADAIGDNIYVQLGTAVSYGIEMGPVFDEIHRSNMSKGDPEPIIRDDGKILKAKNWRPPNLDYIIRRQIEG